MASYEVSIAARTPAAAAPPTITEIGPVVDARSLWWEQELNGVGAAGIRCNPHTLEADIRTRLRDLTAYPCELWIKRDGILVHAGPILGYSIGDDGDLELRSAGLLYYCRFMLVNADQTFAGVDQWTIARTLISQWQALAYGDFGIDTSAVTTSGITRDRSYLGSVEEHPVLQRLEELAACIDGFDFRIDPTTRELELAAQLGSDLSGSVILDQRGITNPGSTTSVAAGDIASDAKGRAYKAATDSMLTSTAANTTLRASFGRVGISGTFDGVTVQATLDDYTEALLTNRGTPKFTADPQLVPVAGAGIDDFGVGDTVTWDFDDGLGRRTLALRVRRLRVTIADDGSEELACEFA